METYKNKLERYYNQIVKQVKSKKIPPQKIYSKS